MIIMKIKWLGHACFLLTSEAGTRIITDPFDNQVGYPVPNEEANIVVTSHDHFDHNYIKAVKNPKDGVYLHISSPGRYSRNGIIITGVSTFHDQAEGRKRGRNVVFVIDIDGLRVCHCGDLGHIPDARQAAEIGRIDILLLPVGGTFTVNAKEAYQVVNLLKPSVTVPMHYKTPEISFNVDGVDKFLSEAGLSGRTDIYAHKREIEVTKANIKTLPEVIVLDYM
jgi:L-ascorbate metabolism protein UlaG (beta-lactamase superfamily)